MIIIYALFLCLGVPSAPGQVISTRETDTSLLIQWAPPKEPNNLIGYYIDQCVKGSKDWTSANHKPHNNTRRVYKHDLNLVLSEHTKDPLKISGWICVSSGLWLVV